MGTKNAPGKFDCYAAAEPDEPMFVLLGRDPIASLLVALWATVHGEMKCLGEKADPAAQERYAEAMRCADQMAEYAVRAGKGEAIVRAMAILAEAAKEYSPERSGLAVPKGTVEDDR